MPVQKLQPNFNLEQDRIEMLKQLIPEAVSDGKIDWDVLKEALGEYLEDEGADVEHFGLSWAGKREARRLASIPSKGTLVPVLGEGIDEDTTGNIFIEGDNLEVLKLLQKSYAGRVRLIYIDPPYNTGNDFIYKDDFSEPTEEYLKRTGQADEDGNLLTTNPKSSGRFHANWLNMMYPRLRLARNLLRDDGIIFVSIDDNEVNNLKCLCNEIFGEENFIAQFIWKSRQFPDTRSVSKVSNDHEYLLAFSKSGDVGLKGIERDESKFSNPDNDPRGDWMSRSILGLATASQRPNLHYAIVDPITEISYNPPENTGWRYAKERMQKMIDGGYILFPSKENGRPREKKFRSDLLSEFISFPTIINDVFTANGTFEIREIFGFEAFDFPKPVVLLKRLIEQAIDKDDLTIDFFSGSCTTAHAVLECNKEDHGNRRFIMVQIPDKTSNSQYPTIADLGKERIRRVIKKIKDEQAEKLDLSEGDPQDLGFKVYKLDRSNLKIWKDYDGEDIPEFEQLSLNFQNPLGESFSEEKVVTEIQLLEGFPLDSKIKQDDKFVKNKVLCVTSEHIGHRLFICLDSKLDISTVQDVRLLEDEDIFICLDNAITDQEKMMLADGCNVKTI
jgi:adenine-specific DNA-methyltransferase